MKTPESNIVVGDRVAVLNRHTGQPGAVIGTVVEVTDGQARVQASKSGVISQWPLKRLVVPAE
jgi:hypothetical protein